ncbi:hypothetical protein GRI39_05015 [Altererythrobacter indicus]|uniref:Tyr recombinase domain-containing protein n=1 Tax=Altericroceibacterium indicum TaxID=374177 RepID=A0A845A6W4_9SPHN|nr:hypothetical protein [Altericroceibacterium indicum]MXP25404.1 hypothetical protein [Altericroceibacterium indicum]
MSRIPFTIRIEGRYSFRRRIHFRNIISKPLTLALQTADPCAARERAAILSARFVIVRADVKTMPEGQRNLTGVEIEAIFRRELEQQLGSWLSAAYENAPWSSSVTEEAARHGEAYRQLRLPDPRYEMDPCEIARLDAAANSAQGAMELTPEWARPLVDQIRDALSDEYVSAALKAIGATPSESNIAAARTHMIRAGASASARAQRVFDEDVLDSADPLRTMMADLGELSAEVKALLSKTEGLTAPAANTSLPSPAPNTECPFAIYDNRRFSEIIEDTLATLKRKKVWKDDKQQRMILQCFAWMTGDRELGSCDHRDVETYVQRLLLIPARGFRFGTLEKGNMSRPFEEVQKELPKLTPELERSLKTVNRDLSTMSTVAKHLERSAWKPRVPGSVVLDFAAATMTIPAEDTSDLRPAWEREQLECLFRSPLYCGGGPGKKRLKTDSLSPQVWHDAAYWAPLIWYYTHACREEICGLEIADVVVDHPVPHIHIRDNFTRGRDGEKSGEKRLARRRKIPLHRQLIRLGFLDYVEAVRAEGHVALFPELYLFESKRGGAQFYDRAWRFMVQWIFDRMEVRVNDKGKGPDIHSIRALGSSFYEVDGVNEILRADVMGHDRTGTNAKHYSKRIQTEGLEIVLRERLEFIHRYVPEITTHLDPTPIRLLPIDMRSRVGSGRYRKLRSDAGKSRKPT